MQFIFKKLSWFCWVTYFCRVSFGDCLRERKILKEKEYRLSIILLSLYKSARGLKKVHDQKRSSKPFFLPLGYVGIKEGKKIALWAFNRLILICFFD